MKEGSWQKEKPNQRHLYYHFTVGNKLNSNEKEMGYIGRSCAGRMCGRNEKRDSKTGFASLECLLNSVMLMVGH